MSLVDRLLGVSPGAFYSVVGLLVFAEDAVFVGFVIPGETAAVLAGVGANLGTLSLPVVIGVVVLAAIAGDSVGYEVGRRLGPRVLRAKPLQRHRKRLDQAQDYLRRRGGSAVFFGRFVAFFRAVMPALAGISAMPYRRFLFWNALGGLVWGTAFVLLGYLAGASYGTVERLVGRGTAVLVAVVVVAGLVVLQVRRHRRTT